MLHCNVKWPQEPLWLETYKYRPTFSAIFSGLVP